MQLNHSAEFQLTGCLGWFILLTSLLSFWRVKRWERGILQSTPASSLPAPGTSSSRASSALLSRLNMLRTGLGFRRADATVGEYPGAALHQFDRDPLAPPADAHDETEEERERNEYIIPIDPNDPEATDRLARAYAEEARLQRALRAAGLL